MKRIVAFGSLVFAFGVLGGGVATAAEAGEISSTKELEATCNESKTGNYVEVSATVGICSVEGET